MEIIGYKCFNKGLISRYGFKFEVGKTYVSKLPIKFGNEGNGFHLCERIEDTFRYFDALEGSVDICLVKGSGILDEGSDAYYEYYDMYAAEKLEILKLLNREEIIKIGLSLNGIRVKRFIQGFKLDVNEIELFKNKFQNNDDVIATIEYYQEKELNAFVKRRGKYYG